MVVVDTQKSSAFGLRPENKAKILSFPKYINFYRFYCETLE